MLFVAFFNPFGLRDASDHHSETWLLRMLAPFYPESGQQDVVVVLIDDQALTDLGASWPLRYGEQARLLRQLLSYQPKSLFVDLLYTQRRYDGGPTESLQRVLSSFREQGVPLILADYHDAQGRSLVLPEFAAMANTAPTHWSGYGERYPLLLPSPQGLRTPALQLYQAACLELDCSQEGFGAPLLVRWGYWSDAGMQDFVDLSGCDLRGQRGTGDRCLVCWPPMHSVRSASPVRLSDHSLVPIPAPCDANQLRDPSVAEVLRGKHVLLGAHIRGIPDFVSSPVQGLLPGVYVHAMALDNLLTQGHSYWRAAPDGWLGVSLSDWLEIALLLLAGLVALWIPSQPAAKGGRLYRCASHYLSWFVLLSSLALLISLYLSRRMHIAPFDWLGLLLMIGLFYAYLGRPGSPSGGISAGVVRQLKGRSSNVQSHSIRAVAV
ncbi:CHASE2 domain-containing protein [Pseudomonas sp. MDMC_285]|nr:CHASE2 domain-containing protein [Pseudomonas sp. MDMC_285]